MSHTRKFERIQLGFQSLNNLIIHSLISSKITIISLYRKENTNTNRASHKEKLKPNIRKQKLLK